MLLSAEHITKIYGTRAVLDGASLYLERGQKLGVIGVNGNGKSTLLRILAGAEEPDGGTVARDPNVRLEYLPQNPAFDPARTVLEQVFDRLSPEARELQEYEAKSILTRLGVTNFEQRMGELSGGQRKRTALAAAEYPIGTELTLTGRLQSRTYLKNLGETSETRTAYEFSVSACERVPEFAIF